MIAALFAASIFFARPETERYLFAQKCQELEQGMTVEQVVGILGGPDEAIKDDRREDLILRYGVIRTGGFASFGIFHFLEGKLNSFPQTLPSHDLPDEATLRKLLQTIDDGGEQRLPYNPLYIVRADNALIRLGKKKGLAVLREYLRALTNWNHPIGFAVIMQTLFEPSAKDGFVPMESIGGLAPARPKDVREAPYYPNVFSCDIPFFATDSQGGTGVALLREYMLNNLEATATFRSGPLMPSDTPWEADDHLWTPQDDKDIDIAHRNVRRQLLRLVATAFKPSAEPPDIAHPWDQGLLDGQWWASTLAQLKATRIRWDALQEMYVRPDGSTIGTVPQGRLYQTRTWRPSELVALNGKVQVFRRYETNARASITWTGGFEPWRGNMLEILSPTGEVLATGPYRPRTTSVKSDVTKSQTRGFFFSLPAGEKVIFQLTWKGQKTRSDPIDLDAMLTSG